MAMNIRARYASAVHSSNLTVKSAKNNTEDAETVIGDPEVLGAYGLADRNLVEGRERGRDGKWRSITPAPLAVPLERLFAGDARAAHEVVRVLAGLAFEESRRLGVKLSQVQSEDMARATLAWYRNGTCKPCGGRGKPLIKDSPVQSANDCDACGGTGKIKFERHFRYEWKPLAVWLRDRLDEESSKAGPAAMRTIAGKMDL